MKEKVEMKEGEAGQSRGVFGRRKKGSSQKSFRREALIFCYLCMLIPLLQWLVFWLYVNWQTIMLAFKNPLTDQWDFTINYEWLWRTQVAIDSNSAKYNGTLIQAFGNTMMFFGISVFFTLPMSVIISYFIYKKIFGYKMFRLAFYLPAVLPSLVMTTVYQQVTQHGGVIDQIFGGVPLGGLLETPETARGAVVAYVLLCSFTTNVLLFSGGMARVPMEVIEAAKLDGVGPFKEIIFLIVPLIWPTVTTQIILAFTNMFAGGGPVLLLTQGKYGTTTISYWLFYQIAGTGRTAIPDGGAGVYRVSAVGLALTAIAVPTILIVRKIFDKVEPVEY